MVERHRDRLRLHHGEALYYVVAAGISDQEWDDLRRRSDACAPGQLCGHAVLCKGASYSFGHAN